MTTLPYLNIATTLELNVLILSGGQRVMKSSEQESESCITVGESSFSRPQSAPVNTMWYVVLVLTQTKPVSPQHTICVS